ncbi:hypothetical protein ACRRTK_009735 [Alexandromys fortis]
MHGLEVTPRPQLRTRVTTLAAESKSRSFDRVKLTSDATHRGARLRIQRLQHSPCLTPQGGLISTSEQPHQCPGHQADRCLPQEPESANELQTVHVVRTCNLASQQLEQWTTRTRLTLGVFRLLSEARSRKPEQQVRLHSPELKAALPVAARTTDLAAQVWLSQQALRFQWPGSTELGHNEDKHWTSLLPRRASKKQQECCTNETHRNGKIGLGVVYLGAPRNYGPICYYGYEWEQREIKKAKEKRDGAGRGTGKARNAGALSTVRPVKSQEEEGDHSQVCARLRRRQSPSRNLNRKKSVLRTSKPLECLEHADAVHRERNLSSKAISVFMSIFDAVPSRRGRRAEGSLWSQVNFPGTAEGNTDRASSEDFRGMGLQAFWNEPVPHLLPEQWSLTPEPDFGDEQMGLHGFHLFHAPQLTGTKELKVEDGISLRTQNDFSMSVKESCHKVVPSPISATLGNKPSLNCIPAITNISDGHPEVRNNDRSSLNQEKTLQILNSVFPKQADLAMNREEVRRALSGEDSDTDLSLMVLPPTSSREEMAAGEVEQWQKTPVSNPGLQSRTEEMVEPEAQTSTGQDWLTEIQVPLSAEMPQVLTSADIEGRVTARLQCTYYTKPVSVELGFRTQEIPVVRMASVIFAGEDTPENVLSDTCQELFCSGSFMVSDDDILENLTLVQLELSKS